MRWLALLLMCLYVGCDGRSAPAPPIDPPIDPPVDPPAKVRPRIVSVSPSTLSGGILGLLGDEITLSAEVTGDGPFTWEWSFGEGVTLDAVDTPSPRVTLQRLGSITGQLTVRGPGGSDTEAFECSIDSAAPVVTSVIQAAGRPTFRQRAKLTATVFGELPRTFEWHFDPRVRVVQDSFRIVEVQADSPGVYGGFLIVRNAHGVSQPVDFTLQIFDAAPVTWGRSPVAAQMPSHTISAQPSLLLHEDAVILMLNSAETGVQCFTTPISGLNSAPTWTGHTAHPQHALSQTEQRMVSLDRRIYVMIQPHAEDSIPELLTSGVGLPNASADWTATQIPGLNPAEKWITPVSLATRDHSLVLGFTQAHGISSQGEVQILQVLAPPATSPSDFRLSALSPILQYSSEVTFLNRPPFFWVGYTQSPCPLSEGCVSGRKWYKTSSTVPLEEAPWEIDWQGPLPISSVPDGYSSYLEILGRPAVVVRTSSPIYGGLPVLKAFANNPAPAQIATPLGANPTVNFAATVLDDRMAIAYVDGTAQSLVIAREQGAEGTLGSWGYAIPVNGGVEGPIDMLTVNNRLLIAFSDNNAGEVATLLSDSDF